MKIEHLTEVTEGFADMKDGFKRTNRWVIIILLIAIGVRSFIEKVICRVIT